MISGLSVIGNNPWVSRVKSKTLYRQMLQITIPRGLPVPETTTDTA